MRSRRRTPAYRKSFIGRRPKRRGATPSTVMAAKFITSFARRPLTLRIHSKSGTGGPMSTSCRTAAWRPIRAAAPSGPSSVGAPARFYTSTRLTASRRSGGARSCGSSFAPRRPSSNTSCRSTWTPCATRCRSCTALRGVCLFPMVYSRRGRHARHSARSSPCGVLHRRSGRGQFGCLLLAGRNAPSCRGRIDTKAISQAAAAVFTSDPSTSSSYHTTSCRCQGVGGRTIVTFAGYRPRCRGDAGRRRPVAR